MLPTNRAKYLERIMFDIIWYWYAWHRMTQAWKREGLKQQQQKELCKGGFKERSLVITLNSLVLVKLPSTGSGEGVASPASSSSAPSWSSSSSSCCCPTAMAIMPMRKVRSGRSQVAVCRMIKSCKNHERVRKKADKKTQSLRFFSGDFCRE